MTHAVGAFTTDFREKENISKLVFFVFKCTAVCTINATWCTVQ